MASSPGRRRQRGRWASLNSGCVAATSRAGGREPRAAAAGLTVDPRRLVTVRQVHGVTTLAVGAPWAIWPHPRPMPGHRSARPAAGRAHRRLRSGPAGRSCGRRGRRRPCRLEGCSGRRARIASWRHGRPRRHADTDHGRGRPLHRPSLLRGRAGVRRTVRREERGQCRFFTTGPGRPRFDLKGYIAPRLRLAGVGRSTYCRTTPAPRRAFLQLPAHDAARRGRLRPAAVRDPARAVA